MEARLCNWGSKITPPASFDAAVANPTCAFPAAQIVFPDWTFFIYFGRFLCKLAKSGQRAACPDTGFAISSVGVAVENLHQSLSEEGFGPPVRSLYFFWVDRYIVEHKDLQKPSLSSFVKGMVDGRFIHKCEVFDFPDRPYLLVCRFTLNLYDVVFFLPDRDGYLAGEKYYMRIKGKIDLVSLRQLFKIFRIKLSNPG